MYMLLVCAGVWGLLPGNNSITVDRLVGQFGVFVVILQYSAFLLVGLYGHLSIITVRIEHRTVTSMLAFFAFAYGLVANAVILIFSGIFNPISTMLYTFAGLVAGIIYLHLKSHQRLGVRGRQRYMK